MTRLTVSLLIAALTLAGLPAQAQVPPPPPPPGGEQLGAAQYDQMVAPIALYPDPLLAQVLTAATYPLEVVQADRWLQDSSNAALRGDQLTAALESEPWDPSVKSLVPFPQILRMMDDNLSWTEQLGDTFLAAQPAVMDSVQRLRQRAEASGQLRSTPQEVVSGQAPAIDIEPATPDTVYVPVYDPDVVYGAWPYPGYPPYYFPGFFGPVVAGGFGWFGFTIAAPLWGWGHTDWHHHRIDIDGDRFNAIKGHWHDNDERHDGRLQVSPGVWQHDPAHRGGVPYRDAGTRAQFAGQAGAAAASRVFRGYPPPAEPPAQASPDRWRGGVPQANNPVNRVPPAPQTQASPERWRTAPQSFNPAPGYSPPQAVAPPSAYRRPQMVAPAPVYRESAPPPVFESYGRGADVRNEAERGRGSREAMPAAPAPAMPAARAMPAPEGRPAAPAAGEWRRRK